MTPPIIFILLTILSYLGVYLIRRYAEKRQLLDYPNDRSSHSAPMPRGGGVFQVCAEDGGGFERPCGDARVGEGLATNHDRR